jgi:hypothetical protein
MTVYELQHRFNLEVQKHGIIDPVLSAIAEDYINYAYQQYVTEKYDSLINPAEKFEATERITRILAPLLADFVETTTFTPVVTNSPDGYLIEGPAALQYIVKDYATISTTDCDGNAINRRARIIPMKHKMVESNKNNPFLAPSDDNDPEIWRLLYSGRNIELILADGQTPYSYTCRYLKKITPVDFNAGTTIAIDDSVHEEIVVRAAYMYLGDLSKNQNKQSDE